MKLNESITVNLGANWLAGQNNVLAKYIETRKDTFSEDHEKLAIKGMILNKRAIFFKCVIFSNDSSFYFKSSLQF